MAKLNYYQPGEAPDASFGLIYRLNKLWTDVDDLACQGKFDAWNFKLDRIFANLIYKNELDYETNDDGEVINIQLKEEDKIIFRQLNKDVIAAKKNLVSAKTPREFSIAKAEYYHALQMKDFALRKFENSLGLYYKKGSGNPSNAMWRG